ncbi:unnamed protein product, partial [Hapterophycus canaliculatus]
YLVWSGASVFGGHVYNARFIVQSNDRSPEYLDQRVECFIAGFREVRVSFLPPGLFLETVRLSQVRQR